MKWPPVDVRYWCRQMGWLIGFVQSVAKGREMRRRDLWALLWVLIYRGF